MAKLVSVAGYKGGGGKSTIAASIATHWASKSRLVTLIDADENGTLTHHFDFAANSVRLVSIPEPGNLAEAIRAEIASDCFCVIVDTPGHREARFLRAMLRSDLVIIPSRASAPDVDLALELQAELAEMREELGLSVALRVALNGARNQKDSRIAAARKALDERGVDVFRAILVDRLPFRDLLAGQKGLSGDAAVEASALAEEVFDILHPRQSLRVIDGGASKAVAP